MLVSAIRAVYDPVKTTPWVCIPFEQRDVAKALLRPDVYGQYSEPVERDDISPAGHINRIAFLIRNGWNDPIEIDVGVPSLGCYVDWAIIDGNHRLYAAIYRGDTHIKANVGGDLNYVKALFSQRDAQ